MPKVDLTITISIILAVCAIVVPTINTMLSNRHQLKMKRLDLTYEESKELRFYHQSIYENYLKCTMRCLNYPNEEALHSYSDYYSLALVYFPSELIGTILEINDYIVAKDRKSALHITNELSEKIRSIIKTA